MFDTSYFMGIGSFQPAVTPPKPAPPPVVAPPADSPVSQGVPTLSVDEAWQLFGFPKKRATREEVKNRYRSMMAKYHPDRNMGNEKLATEYSVKINAALTLLHRHCKW